MGVAIFANKRGLWKHVRHFESRCQLGTVLHFWYGSVWQGPKKMQQPYPVFQILFITLARPLQIAVQTLQFIL
jgi:hypothetical protein